jgi:very-short-patch-repair endonuclease
MAQRGPLEGNLQTHPRISPLDTFRKVLEKKGIPIVHETDTNLWVRVKDLCTVLGLKHSNRVHAYSKEEKMHIKIKTNGGIQTVACFSSEGVKRFLCSTRKPEAIQLCKDLGMHLQTKYVPYETSFIQAIQTAFEGEEMVEQYPVDTYRIDLYFPVHNIAIEVDEYHHATTRNQDLQRHNHILNKLQCRFVRICEDECTYKVINQIYKHIKSSVPEVPQLTRAEPTEPTEPAEPPADPEVKPLSILPNTHITSMQQFYQTWVSEYKQQYLEHKQKHDGYLWTKVFGKQTAHQAKQRYHKSSPFLSFIDSQVDPEATLAWLNALATERKIEPNRFVRNIFPKALKPELRCPCMRSRGPCSCNEDSAFLRAKLTETGRLQ